jgi:hypothetical protein
LKSLPACVDHVSSRADHRIVQHGGVPIQVTNPSIPLPGL